MIPTHFIWLLIEKHLVGSDCLGAKQLYRLLLDKSIQSALMEEYTTGFCLLELSLLD